MFHEHYTRFLKSIRRPFQVLATFALVLGLMATVVSPAAASEPAPDTATARYEVRFLEGMIDHHMMAVMMAEVCVQYAIHEELQTMCENIIAAQSAEMEEMQTWLADWYDIEYEPRMTPGMERQIERLEELAQTDPAAFEIEFMESMIRHHTQAIREAQMCVDRAYHGELVSLCENIIATQSEEIETMQAWLCEWYEICRE
jgi:uncharacterized protein (DUF305 family)